MPAARKILCVGSVYKDGKGSYRLAAHSNIGEYVDGLTSAMFVVVTVVSSLVQIYSTSYMHGDRRYTWFFSVAMMTTLWRCPSGIGTFER